MLADLDPFHYPTFPTIPPSSSDDSHKRRLSNGAIVSLFFSFWIHNWIDLGKAGIIIGVVMLVGLNGVFLVWRQRRGTLGKSYFDQPTNI